MILYRSIWFMFFISDGKIKREAILLSHSPERGIF